MDNYILQRYFKTVCNNYFVAYKERVRIKTLKHGNESFWNNKLREKMWEIDTIVKTIAHYKMKIIVTSEEEIIPLIEFFENEGMKKYQIINTDEMYSDVFPQDEMSKRFLEAYKEGSSKKMHELFMQCFEV